MIASGSVSLVVNIAADSCGMVRAGGGYDFFFLLFNLIYEVGPLAHWPAPPRMQ